MEILKDSPAGAKVFYDKKEDKCILKYQEYTLIYSERISGLNGKLPFCFSKCEKIIDNEDNHEFI